MNSSFISCADFLFYSDISVPFLLFKSLLFDFFEHIYNHSFDFFFCSGISLNSFSLQGITVGLVILWENHVSLTFPITYIFALRFMHLGSGK